MEKPLQIPKPDEDDTKLAAASSSLKSSTLANNNSNTGKNQAIWDCGSSLYDSFELNSFQKQLDSAIISSSRSFSMPRLPSYDIRGGPAQKKPPVASKFSRSFQKLLRSIFRAPRPNSSSKPNSSDNSSCGSSPDPWFLDHFPAQTEVDKKKKDGDGGSCFAVYEKPNALSTIPEVSEVGFSAEVGGSLVRRTMSDRFTAASVGIYCA